MKCERIRVEYGDLSSMLKNQINLVIPDKNGKRKFGRPDLMMLMQWCYIQGILDTGDAMSKICFDETLEDRTDFAAAISIYFSSMLAKMGTQRTRELSELSKLCGVMEDIYKESTANEVH